jgi:hypothetical protein
MGKKFQSRGAERKDQVRAITLATRAITPWAKPKKTCQVFIIDQLLSFLISSMKVIILWQ